MSLKLIFLHWHLFIKIVELNKSYLFNIASSIIHFQSTLLYNNLIVSVCVCLFSNQLKTPEPTLAYIQKYFTEG